MAAHHEPTSAALALLLAAAVVLTGPLVVAAVPAAPPPGYSTLVGTEITCGTGYAWSYKVKYFETVRQVSSTASASSSSSLAGTYAGYDSGDHSKLVFTGGDTCGGSLTPRTADVTLHCAGADVSICGEPGGKGCHYQVHHFTPKACGVPAPGGEVSRALTGKTITCRTGDTGQDLSVDLFTSAYAAGGGSTTYAAGTFSSLELVDGRLFAQYTQGNGPCPNSGAYRSLTVTLLCGPSEGVTCSETTECAYQVAYTSPLICATPPAPKTYQALPAGFDYPNNDLYKSIMPKCGTTRETCQALCDSVPGCFMYVFGSPSWGTNCCSLKSAVGKAKAQPGLTAYKANA